MPSFSSTTTASIDQPSGKIHAMIDNLRLAGEGANMDAVFVCSDAAISVASTKSIFFVISLVRSTGAFEAASEPVVVTAMWDGHAGASYVIVDPKGSFDEATGRLKIEIHGTQLGATGGPGGLGIMRPDDKIRVAVTAFGSNLEGTSLKAIPKAWEIEDSTP